MKNAIREIETFHKELHCRISRSKRFFEKGLNMTQLQIMHYLFKHPGEEVCQRDLEDFLHLKKADILKNGRVKTLSSSGYVIIEERMSGVPLIRVDKEERIVIK